jgi:hypothetical protein
MQIILKLLSELEFIEFKNDWNLPVIIRKTK